MIRSGVAISIALALLAGPGSRAMAGRKHARATRPAPSASSAPPAMPAAAPPAADRLQAAIELTFHPERRSEGIAVLQVLAQAEPDSFAIRRALARALAWERRFKEAAPLYEWLLRRAPPSEARAITFERLQVFEWSGQARAAADGYEALLKIDPRDVDAWIGLARARRYLGRPLAARTAARMAVRLAPERHDAREELAWSDATLGRGRAAEADLAGAPASTELADRLLQLRRPTIGASAVVSGNSFGILRLAPRVALAISLPRDFTVLVGAGMTHLQQSTLAVDYATAAAGVAVPFGPLRASASFGVYAGANLLLFDGQARLAVHPVDGFTASVAYRHHPFIELVDPLTTDEQMFHGAGVGGAQVLAQVLGLEADALSLDLLVNPWRWGFLYGSGRVFHLSDGNQGYSAAAGLGIDALGFVSRPLPVSLYARWDSYFTGYQQLKPAYYSPPLLDVHSVGPELRVRVWKLELAASGGLTLALIENAPQGFFAGGSARLQTRHIAVEARGDYRADPYYQSWRAWLGIVVYP